MEETGIQWCDDTVNPTMGCDGCELWNAKTNIFKCYAGQLHVLRAGKNPGHAPRFEDVTLFPGRMVKAAKKADLRGRKRKKKPWLNGYPRLIFVSDMSDALSKVVSFEFLESEVITHVTSPHGRRHVWLWLTKLPARMARFSAWLKVRDWEWPRNLWPGTSLTGKTSTSRVKDLLKVGNDRTTRFLSVEPQWEEIPLEREVGQIDWVIQGGESGAGSKKFDIDWARQLRDVCREKNTPYFLKQVGANAYEGRKNLDYRDSHGGEWGEWPKDLRVRQIPLGK